jgi:hypothetical protein
MAKRSKEKSPTGLFRSYSFVWVTAGLFIISFVGHWTAGWFTFVKEQKAHQEPIEITDYVVEMTRDTLENWQSEFLQVMWQVGGLAFLLFVGSPQSKEGNERMEAKLDQILRELKKEDSDKVIQKLDRQFHRAGQ